MLIVENFLSFFIVTFNVGIETSMVEGEIRLGVVPDSGVKSFPCWSNTGDDNNVEKCRSYLST